MKEKRKPYASITIYKPRFSRLVSIAILLILIAALGSRAMREIDGWRSALSKTEQRLQASSELLHDRKQRLQAVEAKLERAEDRLRTEPLTWRTLEPAGFSVEPTVDGWQGLMTATVCARGHMYYEAYTHFFSRNRFFVAELVHSGDYVLAGKAPAAIDGRYIRFYTHKDALEFDAYTWDESRNQATDHVAAWQNRLASYCSASFE
ncbi:MAG: hypothetical protein F4X02_11530 [Chloroflexi bacterium]|nr:hypothetical protein [Chloroflexota bacterium]